jgi:hypothetical protein
LAYSLRNRTPRPVIRRPSHHGPVSDSPVVRCFPSFQNCSIKRTPGRTLFTRSITLSAGGALAGRRNAARKLALRYRFRVCYTEVIMLASADVFPVVSGRCTGRARRCKAKQGPRGKTAPTAESYSHSSTVFGRHQEGKRISLVTTGQASTPSAQRSSCRCPCQWIASDLAEPEIVETPDAALLNLFPGTAPYGIKARFRNARSQQSFVQ